MITSLMLNVLVGPGFDLKFIPSGLTSKIGGYSPIRAEMTPLQGNSKWPNAMTGKIKVGDKEFAFILDEPASGEAKLLIDSNGNGNFDDDKAPVWAPKAQGSSTMYFGNGEVLVGGKMGTINLYRFDKNDPQRAALKNTVLYYFDFGYEGKAQIGNKSFPVLLSGPVSTTSRLWIDRNGNGKNDGRSESIAANAPFNIGGTTYDLKVTNGTFEAVKSDKSVAEIPLPPDLSIGQLTPKFSAVTTDGTKVEFPGSYKGKVVLIDFWATWCGPCIAELPNVLKAYEKFHGKGLEILGISFDRAGDGEKLAAFTKEKGMTWPQVFEGKFWETTIGTQYGVEGIPFCLLIDGDSGKIIATVSTLRGENLDKTLTEVFSKRRG